jgi:RES domain-containing protein
VYTSESLALAALEYLVHVPADLAPTDLLAITIELPDDIGIELVDVSKLPARWYDYSGSAACLDRGDAWLAEGASAVLKVPAAPVPQENNFLISPAHADARRVRVLAKRPFRFDPRLIK